MRHGWPGNGIEHEVCTKYDCQGYKGCGAVAGTELFQEFLQPSCAQPQEKERRKGNAVLVRHGVPIHGHFFQPGQQMAEEEEWHPQDGHPGKKFINLLRTGRVSEISMGLTARCVIDKLVLLNKVEPQVMVDENCRQVSIIALPVVADNPVPWFFGRFKPEKKQDIDDQDDFRRVLVDLIFQQFVF